MNYNLVHLLKDYITERYGAGACTAKFLASYQYATEQEGLDFTLIPHLGFISYRFEGDACIIYDMYVVPGSRRQDLCLDMFRRVLRRAEEAGKYVIIGLRETGFTGDELGLNAMKSVGFTEQPGSQQTVYLRHGATV